MRQLFMQDVIGAPFDWGLAAADFAKEWQRSAMASHRSDVRASGGPVVPALQFDLWPGEILEAAPTPWRAQAPDRTWTDAPRPTSIPARRLSRRELAVRSARLQVAIPERPRIRADCVSGIRPCPWVSCRHHLYLEVGESGWLKVNWPHLDPGEMKESCSLDVADRAEDEGVTLEQLGALFNISLEGARQVEIEVLAEVRTKLGEEGTRALITGGGADDEGEVVVSSNDDGEDYRD